MTTDEGKAIVLGNHYRDTITGVVGRATSKHHYLHGCTRVGLEWVEGGEMKDWTFDAPRLEHVEKNKKGEWEVVTAITSTRTGGPGRVPGARTTGR